MRRREVFGAAAALGAASFSGITAHAEQTGTPLCRPSDPAALKDTVNCHGGAGTVRLGSLIKSDEMDTNFHAMSWGIIPPGTGIGEHLHRDIEEIFIILDGPARFTKNGTTSVLPPGSMVVCNIGDSHGIYNHTDKPFTWLYFAAVLEKGKASAIDFGDDLTNAKLTSPPPFEWTLLDESILGWSEKAHKGAGPIGFRRMYNKESFKTNWEFLDHCVLPPGSSIGYHQHNSIEEIYYLAKGSGRMTVNDHTWDVGPGDAIPCTLHDSHGLWNNSDEDITLIVCSCNVKKGARDTNNWGDDLVGR